MWPNQPSSRSFFHYLCINQYWSVALALSSHAPHTYSFRAAYKLTNQPSHWIVQLVHCHYYRHSDQHSLHHYFFRSIVRKPGKMKGIEVLINPQCSKLLARRYTLAMHCNHSGCHIWSAIGIGICLPSLWNQPLCLTICSVTKAVQSTTNVHI